VVDSTLLVYNRKKMNDRTQIPFNKPFIAGKELFYIAQAVTFGNISGDGHFTKKCSEILEERLGVHKILLTPSGTAALEMAAMLCDLQPGDEVILPSYTFVSTASAFVRLGVKPVFVDIRADTLNIDENLIEAAITSRTKVIVPVHYGGVACAMDRILAIAEDHNLLVVEDAAQGVHSFQAGRALGSIGRLGAYSFHETKSYICGEGGALCINSPELIQRAEIIRDKGTNRQEFLRGEVDRYTWVDHGSSYVPSEIVSAFLFGQLELLDSITERRREIYQLYQQSLQPLEDAGVLRLPRIPEQCRSNYHNFYILLNDGRTRDKLIAYLRDERIAAVSHFEPLHSSPMGRTLSDREIHLPVTEELSTRLLRLPFYFTITADDQQQVVRQIETFLMASSD